MPGRKPLVERYCRRHGAVDVEPDTQRCPERVGGRMCRFVLDEAPRKERDRESWMGSLSGMAGGPLPSSPPPSPYEPEWLSAEEARRLRAAGRML